MNTKQHIYEKIETAKVLCGECNHIWHLSMNKIDDFLECPKCKSSAMTLRVDHIIKK